MFDVVDGGEGHGGGSEVFGGFGFVEKVFDLVEGVGGEEGGPAADDFIDLAGLKFGGVVKEGDDAVSADAFEAACCSVGADEFGEFGLIGEAEAAHEVEGEGVALGVTIAPALGGVLAPFVGGRCGHFEAKRGDDGGWGGAHAVRASGWGCEGGA